jgi:alpha-methylacyl-CoA racemase
MRPLHLKVLDLSHRLPGPLAGKLLADQGADVVKLEDQVAMDPFLEGLFAQFDSSFVDWYHALNEKKQVVRLDFKASNAKELVRPWLEWADVVLMGLSEKLATQLGVDPSGTASLTGARVFLSMGASRQSKTAMHDLNVLAETGLLKLHVAGQTQSPLPPPFLPVAGISFGQQTALTALALHQQAVRENKCVISKVFMQEEIENSLTPFWPKRQQELGQTKFLHNGAYPCYCLYRTKDGDWLAVAAVEEKFWLAFSQAFQLKLENRFDRNPESFEQVARAVSARTTAELEHLLEGKDICVSVIRA